MATPNTKDVVTALQERWYEEVRFFLEELPMDDYPNIIRKWAEELGNSFSEVMGGLVAYLIPQDIREVEKFDLKPFPEFWESWLEELEMDDLFDRLASQPEAIEENILWISQQPNINFVGEIWPLLQYTIGRIKFR